jgi:HTH-type transcriptional regulator/antitoxin HigA
MAKEVFAPGEYISEELEARGWTQDDLARVMGRSLPAINKIISGKTPITPEIAIELGAAFSTSAEVWLNLEAHYRLSRSGQPDENISRRARLYSLAPVKFMEKRGWLRNTRTTEQLEDKLRGFYNVKALNELPELEMAARAGGAGKEEIWAARLAWAIRIKNLAASLKAAPFDSLGEAKLGEIRRLAKRPEDIEQVPALLARLGIRFLVVEHLPRTKIDGIALWLSEHDPVIGMSLRYDRIDYFWHTLMHELSHIHNRDKEIVDVDLFGDKTAETESEKRANKEAAETLVDPGSMEAFTREGGSFYDQSDIVSFAEEIGVHPGIIVGQLQYHNIIPYSLHRQMLVKVRHYALRNACVDGWPIASSLAHLTHLPKLRERR